MIDHYLIPSNEVVKVTNTITVGMFGFCFVGIESNGPHSRRGRLIKG